MADLDQVKSAAQRENAEPRDPACFLEPGIEYLAERLEGAKHGLACAQRAGDPSSTASAYSELGAAAKSFSAACSLERFAAAVSQGKPDEVVRAVDGISYEDLQLMVHELLKGDQCALRAAQIIGGRFWAALNDASLEFEKNYRTVGSGQKALSAAYLVRRMEVEAGVISDPAADRDDPRIHEKVAKDAALTSMRKRFGPREDSAETGLG